MLVFIFFFFFFQAEDGIRDIGVTGVQTCALPISGRAATPRTTHDEAGRTEATPAAGGAGWVKRLAVVLLMLLVLIDGYNRNIATGPPGLGRISIFGFPGLLLRPMRLTQEWGLFAPN